MISFMSLKEKLKKASRNTLLFHRRTYRRLGLWHFHKQIDISLAFMLALCFISFPILMKCSFKKVPTEIEISEVLPEEEGEEVVEEEETTTINETEEVHEDLGDAPVEAEQHVSLNELEKRVQLGELTMENRALKKGESLITVLSQENVPAAERMEIVEALELFVNLKNLRPGMNMALFKEEGKLVGISLMIKDAENVSVLKEIDGTWTPFSHAGRVVTKTKRWEGKVERTFSGSAKRDGVPENLVNQIINALDGEIDFSTDIKAGASFDIIAEYKETEGGLEIGSKQLLYVGLSNGKKEIHRYAYTPKNGTTGFYDAQGRSMGKAIMKRPLKANARVSSPFGTRFHPILKYKIFHKGVDLAAPKNTPVMAAADGTIELLGRKGGYGKYISIKHANGWQTAYAHLNGYRKDLKVGSHVKRGEVIGYVGSTGRSTGPHLHFEVLKNKKVVAPFGNNVIQGSQLTGYALEQFQLWAETIHPDFNQHLAGKVPPIPMPKPF